MRRLLLALALTGLAGPTPVRADGLLVPTDRGLPPLALVYQRVNVDIDGQVATTTVEQAYRNSTGRDLEADYLFPLPPGASVRDFSMWVGGKRFRGEAVEADEARRTYEDIVRRLKDPGLLEYVGRDLWKMRIYPVPARGEQKIEIRFTSVLPRDGDLISYRYPLRTGQTPRKTIGDFTMTVRLKSPEPLGPIYSPSHDVAIDRKGDREAVASFERSACTLDRDFLLYFAPGADRLGFSLMAQRDVARRARLLPAAAEPARRGPDAGRPPRPGLRPRHLDEHGRREDAAGQGGDRPGARFARARRPLRADPVRHRARAVPRGPAGRHSILALGGRVTWVSPSGTAVVIDERGQADVADAVLDRLFAGPG